MIGTIPADLAQYYWHVLQLSQKLAYIYGWPDLLDGKNQFNESTKQILTLFVGVMSGAEVANKALREFTKQATKEVGKRVANLTLSKTVWYSVVKKVGKWIGVKITKDTVGRAASKAVPVIGALTSGGLTYLTFKPMARRLQKELREQMLFTKNSGREDNEYTVYEEVK